LRDLLAASDQTVEVWSEAWPGPPERLHPRDRLAPAETLVIWTVPPGPAELARALEAVAPRQVVLFAQGVSLDDVRSFMARLAGLLKYDLTARDGHTLVTGVAAALGHREATVRKGIAWLVARGQIKVLAEEQDAVTLGTSDGRASGDADRVYRELLALLEETAAYRSYYRRAEASTLIPSRRK
jgi:single-stranded-DNA-specific exonuclease